jgi:hypothetical protein
VLDNATYVFGNLPRGSYFVYARVPEVNSPSGFFPAMFGSTIVEIADEDVDAGTIPLQLAIELVGQIKFTATISSAVNIQRIQVSLIGVGGQSRGETRRVYLNEDGTFRVPNLPKGSYRITLISLPDSLFLESVLYSSRKAADLTFVIEAEPSGPLELSISGPAGMVQGTVRNSLNGVVRGAQVVLIPSTQLRSNPDLYKIGFTDQNGAFNIRGVSPGDYQVLAWEHLESGASQNSEFVSRFESRAAKVTVGAGSLQNLNLRAISESN